MKEINVLASLSGNGGGEKAIVKIVTLLRENGWKVYLIPWGNVHPLYKNVDTENFNVKNMAEKMVKNIPLFFYGNGQIYEFKDKNVSEKIIDNSSDLVLGINFVIGGIYQSQWIKETNKLRAVFFLNSEKKEDWEKRSIFNKDIPLKVLFGASDVEKYLTIPIKKRERNSPFIVSRLSRGDSRKFVASKDSKKGEMCHCWQKVVNQELDIYFYEKLLKDIPNINFHFMSYSKELYNCFRDNDKFKFYRFDEITITDFLKQSHVFLYRVNQCLRDQGPRVFSEAMAGGLPCLAEPRDGPRDRIVHGYNGFYTIEYDDYKSKLLLLEKNDDLRIDMANNAREFAKIKLDPNYWVKAMEEVLCQKQI